MGLIELLIVILVLGLLFWLIKALPIEEPFKSAAYIILVVIALFWLLGMLSGHLTVPRLR